MSRQAKPAPLNPQQQRLIAQVKRANQLLDSLTIEETWEDNAELAQLTEQMLAEHRQEIQS